ncbi:hypothetical protein CV739_24665 [Bacillus velezensis]|nr:hypothetical protein CV739_24665 [Bacillus velezensis]
MRISTAPPFRLRDSRIAGDGVTRFLIAVNHLDVGQIIKNAIGEVFIDLDTTKEAERIDQALAAEDAKGVPVVSQGHIRELQSVLEDLDKAFRDVGLIVELRNVNNEAVAGDGVPLLRELAGVWCLVAEPNHVNMRVPQAGALAALKLDAVNAASGLCKLDVAILRWCLEVIAASLRKPLHRAAKVAKTLG